MGIKQIVFIEDKHKKRTGVFLFFFFLNNCGYIRRLLCKYTAPAMFEFILNTSDLKYQKKKILL